MNDKHIEESTTMASRQFKASVPAPADLCFAAREYAPQIAVNADAHINATPKICKGKSTEVEKMNGIEDFAFCVVHLKGFQ